MMPSSLRLLVIAALAAAACARTPPAREFAFRGQVLAVEAGKNRITIKHEDIPGFMDAMTMPFEVRDRALIEGRAAGDLVEGTLVVTDDDAWVTRLVKTGFAPVVAQPPPRSLFRVVDLLEPGDEVPDATFVDQHGSRLSLSGLRGSAVVLTFIYTRCPLPTFCPALDRRFVELQRLLEADEARRGHVQLLSVSFDPDYDTPEVLQAHAKRLGADPAVWRFVAADQETITSFGARLGLVVMREPQDPANITHNLRTAVVDAGGRLVKVFGGSEWTPREVLAALPHTTTH